jgi:hypothetical protein
MTGKVDQLDIAIPKIFFSLLLGNVHTAMPGLVQSFDRDKQTITVQPVLQRRFEDRDTPENLPILEDIKVMFFGAGGYWVTVDITPGSYVLLIVNERSLDNWLETGGICDPDSMRFFDFSDSVAIPGILPNNEALGSFDADCMTIRNLANDLYIKIQTDKIAIKVPTLEIEGDVTIDGALEVSGDSTASDHVSMQGGVIPISGSGHIHNDSTGGPCTAPIPAP